MSIQAYFSSFLHSVLVQSNSYWGDGSAMQAEPIWQLLRDTYWACRRELEIVARNHRAALTQCGYFHNGQLKAYLRVEEDWLYDVIVSPELRGRGIGSELLSRVLADPKVEALPRLALNTRDADDFYSRFGFERDGHSPNGSWVMSRPNPLKRLPANDAHEYSGHFLGNSLVREERLESSWLSAAVRGSLGPEG